MLKKLDASEWQAYTPEGKGEKRSIIMPLATHAEGIEFEVRCVHPVEVNAITEGGLTVLLDWGQKVQFAGRLTGFVAVEVVTDCTFVYRSKRKVAWFETNDGVPLAVAIDDDAQKPIKDLVAMELRKYIGKMQAADMFRDDAAVEELLDDIDNGDLEFDEEPDPYGLGYEEQTEMFDDDPEGPPEPEEALEPPAKPIGARPPQSPPTVKKSAVAGTPAPKAGNPRREIAEERDDD